MVEYKLFDLGNKIINHLQYSAKREHCRPFGGITVVLAGDFYSYYQSFRLFDGFRSSCNGQCVNIRLLSEVSRTYSPWKHVNRQRIPTRFVRTWNRHSNRC